MVDWIGHIKNCLPCSTALPTHTTDKQCLYILLVEVDACGVMRAKHAVMIVDAGRVCNPAAGTTTRLSSARKSTLTKAGWRLHSIHMYGVRVTAPGSAWSTKPKASSQRRPARSGTRAVWRAGGGLCTRVTRIAVGGDGSWAVASFVAGQLAIEACAIVSMWTRMSTVPMYFAVPAPHVSRADVRISRAGGAVMWARSCI
jgi:hypothetical protein